MVHHVEVLVNKVDLGFFDFSQPIIIPAMTSTFNRDHVMVKEAHVRLQ